MNIPGAFKRIVDDLILQSEKDVKLAESIRWIDLQSQKNNINFYEMAYCIADNQLSNRRAREWLMAKLNNDNRS
jgi:hypothetical protein